MCFNILKTREVAEQDVDFGMLAFVSVHPTAYQWGIVRPLCSADPKLMLGKNEQY